MRSKLRSGFVLLVAMLAIGAVGVSSASAALPEFSGGKFPNKFKGTFGATNFGEELGSAWSFNKGQISGEITGPSTVGNVTLTFSEASEWKNSCLTTGEKKPELTLTGLQGRLGYINKATKSVGLYLQAPRGTLEKCHQAEGDFNKEYRGEFIAKIGPLFVSETKKFTLSLSQSGGIQNPLWFEGETEKAGETFPFRVQFPEYCGKVEGKEVCLEGKTEGQEVGIGGSISFETEHGTELRG